MLDKIKALLHEVENMKVANAEELEALRIKYLSKKGEISALMNDFRNSKNDCPIFWSLRKTKIFISARQRVPRARSTN